MPPETGNPVMKSEPVKLFPGCKYLNSNLTEFFLGKEGVEIIKSALKNTRNHNMQLKFQNYEKSSSSISPFRVALKATFSCQPKRVILFQLVAQFTV